jgi:hypothetical protein
MVHGLVMARITASESSGRAGYRSWSGIVRADARERAQCYALNGFENSDRGFGVVPSCRAMMAAIKAL